MQGQHDENGGAVFIRVRGSLFDQIENWRRAQPTIPSRSEALRHLIKQALAAHSAEAATS